MVGSVKRGEEKKQKFTKSNEKLTENPSKSTGCGLQTHELITCFFCLLQDIITKFCLQSHSLQGWLPRDYRCEG